MNGNYVNQSGGAFQTDQPIFDLSIMTPKSQNVAVRECDAANRNSFLNAFNASSQAKVAIVAVTAQAQLEAVAESYIQMNPSESCARNIQRLVDANADVLEQIIRERKEWR